MIRQRKYSSLGQLSVIILDSALSYIEFQCIKFSRLIWLKKFLMEKWYPCQELQICCRIEILNVFPCNRCLRLYFDHNSVFATNLLTSWQIEKVIKVYKSHCDWARQYKNNLWCFTNQYLEHRHLTSVHPSIYEKLTMFYLIIAYIFWLQRAKIWDFELLFIVKTEEKVLSWGAVNRSGFRHSFTDSPNSNRKETNSILRSRLVIQSYATVTWPCVLTNKNVP